MLENIEEERDWHGRIRSLTGVSKKDKEVNRGRIFRIKPGTWTESRNKENENSRDCGL